MKSPIILHNEIDDTAFLKIQGKGSFKESTTIEQYGKESIDAGKKLHIDLQECNGMDSTFMGVLAKLSIRQTEKIGNKLSVLNANQKNSNSLMGLGLGFLMNIYPDWGDLEVSKVQRLKQRLETCASCNKVHTSHVYDAHSTLCDLNEENRNKFGSLMEGLDYEMANE